VLKGYQRIERDNQKYMVKKHNSQHCIHKTKNEKTTRTLTKETWVNSNAAEGKLFPSHTLCVFPLIVKNLLIVTTE